jgi:transposase
VAADLGIAANQLHRWRRQHADNVVDAFPGNGKINSRDEELHRLRNELKRVTEERDFLKKTAAFFAKTSR